MLLTVEKRFRGGVSGVFGSHFDKRIAKIVIYCVDAKNLLGWAVVPASQYSEFEEEKVSWDKILATADVSEVGYFLDVDLEKIYSSFSINYAIQNRWQTVFHWIYEK